MKPAPFDYVRAFSVDEAVGLLSDGTDSKVIAGGQSLVPLLAMRLARPERVVDINFLQDLPHLHREGGHLVVGALARQRQVELSNEVSSVPLLSLALPFIGHRELRNRGTVVGSLAHADPSAELPAIAALLRATMFVMGPEGSRELNALDFMVGPFQTRLRQDELITAVSFPVRADGDGYGFEEVSRRRGDFALVGSAAWVHLSQGGVDRAEAALFGVGATPVVVDLTRHLSGFGESDLTTAVLEPSREVAQGLEPLGDQHGSSGYRRRLAEVLLARSLAWAYQDARRSS